MQVEPAISKAQQRPIGHRYQVLGLRGSGAEASVHLAIDLFTGQEVALKLGPPERLAPEYRRSAALAHPHLARAVSLWHEAGGASLALEYGAEDLTALAVTLPELLSGTNPFAAGTPAEVIRAHFESVPPLGASPGVRAVVAKLLAREPRSRYPHADAVIEALAAATGLPLESEGE